MLAWINQGSQEYATPMEASQITWGTQNSKGELLKTWNHWCNIACEFPFFCILQICFWLIGVKKIGETTSHRLRIRNNAFEQNLHMKIWFSLEFVFVTLGNHVIRFGNAGCRLAKTPVCFYKNPEIKLTYLRKSALRLHGSSLLSALKYIWDT